MKTLFDLPEDQVLVLDELMFLIKSRTPNDYEIVSENNIMLESGMSGGIFNSMKDILYDYHLIEPKFNASVEHFRLLARGKKIVDMGGLYYLYQQNQNNKQLMKNANFAKWVSIVAASIAFLSLVAQIVVNVIF